jgi:hypothetical protein
LRRVSSRLISFAASEPDIMRPISVDGTDAITLALRGVTFGKGRPTVEAAHCRIRAGL